MKTRIVSLIMAFFMIISAATVIASADSSVIIAVDSIKIEEGSSEASFDIIINNAPKEGLISVKLWVAVDGAKITKISGKLPGNFASEQDVENPTYPELGCIVFWVTSSAPVYEDGTAIASVCVEIPEDAVEGDVFDVCLTLDSDPDSFLDATAKMNRVAVTAEDGSITVFKPEEIIVPPLYGDVNGDGLINLRDVAMMMRAQAGWIQNGYIEENQDYVTDGKFNARDIAMLMRDIANGLFD